MVNVYLKKPNKTPKKTEAGKSALMSETKSMWEADILLD
jgi:hypothetical protein